MRFVTVSFATVLVLSLASSSRAEPARTGLEVFIDRVGPVYLDRELRLRGTAYEVLGLARLRPLPGARVRARYGGTWSEAVAGDRGLFEINIAVPERPRFRWDDRPHMDLVLSHGDERRSFDFYVDPESPIAVFARTDRHQYEPGETMHIWARVYDRLTGRPLAGVPVEVSLGSGARARTLETSASGVVSYSEVLPDWGGIHHDAAVVRVVLDGYDTTQTMDYRVGQRPQTNLFVTVEATPETVSPGDTVRVTIQVRSPSGFPVRNAYIMLSASEQEAGATTDRDGNATVTLQAPQYAGTAIGLVEIQGTVRHRGYGSADLRGSFRVRPPDSLEIDALLPQGGVVPEVRSRLFLSVFHGGGNRPAAGARVEVRGPAIERGRATGTVDRHGLVAIPVRPGAGTYARHIGDGNCDGVDATTIDVVVEGETTQETRLCLYILEHAMVAPSVRRPVVAPGETVEVEIARRPAVAARPVVVELFHNRPWELLDVAVVPPGSDRVRLTVPDDRMGLLSVQARPLLDERGPAGDLVAASAEARGAMVALLVRPEAPSFPRIELDREVYSIRGQARVAIRTPANVPESWSALLVRDLAQHQGEEPFEEYFLDQELRRAVLDPTTPEAELMVRAALATSSMIDEGEGTVPRVFRDPLQQALELREQRAGEWMVAVEAMLGRALDTDTVAEMTEGEGPDRRFQPDVVERAVEDELPLTLGDSPVTVDMLTDLDPSFSFETVARRLARRRLVRLLGLLMSHYDPEGNDLGRPRGHAAEPPERWLSELVRLGEISPSDLRDPWGGTYVLRRTGRTPAFTIAVEAEGYELVSPGPDGRAGTADDVSDPLARVVPEGTLYARACREDWLMAQLAALSPGYRALQDLLAAYDRLTDEALEEMAGEYLAGGHAYGSGYGRGAAGLRGRRTRAPRVVTGCAAVRGLGGLAGVVRQEFPATLFFETEAEIDPSGRTVIDVPLAEAPTTYVAELILWRADGWVWSASTQIRVDQDLLVDAPVPTSATAGDDVLLPLRVANRTKTDRTLRLEVTGSDELGLEPIKAGTVTVPAEDAIEVPVVVSPRQPAKGMITVAAYDPSGDAIDAVRRPMTVRLSQRRARELAEVVLRGAGEVELTVPEGATPGEASHVLVLLGPAIFRHGEHPSWTRWLRDLIHEGRLRPAELTSWEIRLFEHGGSPDRMAQLVGADWLCSGIDDETLEVVIEGLTDHVEGVEADGIFDVRHLARLLMLLAPAANNAEARPSLTRPLRRLIRALRVKVESGAALFADAPWLSARAAAALIWTSDRHRPGARARELLDRARASLVAVNDELWLEAGSDDTGEELYVASSLLALAEARSGSRETAFRLVRSMARLLRSSGGTLPEVEGLLPEERMMTAAAALALQDETVDSVEVVIDGARRRIELEEERGELRLAELGEAGTHRIELIDPGGAVALLRAEAEYGVSWSQPAPHAGPFALSIEGTPGQVDERSGLRLVVRNRVPRLIRSSVVEITLPAGVEVDEESRRVIRRHTRDDPDVSSEVIRLRLGPLGPRAQRVVPLPWVWTSAGRLTGLGVLVRAEDRPEAVSILPSRRVEITHPEAGLGGAR